MTKTITRLVILATLAITLPARAQTEVINGTTYDIVSISIDAPSYDASQPPAFARVKYNKLCPLVITSDDMGRVEFVRNWAYYNGYPVFNKEYFGQQDDPMTLFNTPYNAGTQQWQEADMAATSYTTPRART
ncbi:MAG: hypothetical protein IJ637_08885 [Prevotella sp.]|nr:hypothetical protein [Prevotella sp.]